MKSGTGKLRSPQRGISIVLVLFLLVVAGGLALSVTGLLRTQSMNTAYAYLSTQSYFAARSGVEMGIARVIAGTCNASETVAVAGHAVQVTCTQVGGPYNEGNPVSYSLFRITATATNGSFSVPDVSNRVVTATIRN